MSAEAYVYVLETGAYANRGVWSVHATLEGAKLSGAQESEPSAGIWRENPNGCVWNWRNADGSARFDDSAATVTRYLVES